MGALSILSGFQRAQLRSYITQVLPDSCDLTATVDVTDGSGGYKQTWPTVTATVACLVQERQVVAVGAGGEMVVLPQEEGRLVTLPHGTTVKPSWRIDWSGKTLEVLDVLQPGSDALGLFVHAVQIAP